MDCTPFMESWIKYQKQRNNDKTIRGSSQDEYLKPIITATKENKLEKLLKLTIYQTDIHTDPLSIKSLWLGATLLVRFYTY